MERITSRNSLPILFFFGVALGVYATALTFAATLNEFPRPSPLVLGMTLDMVVVVPLAFYFLVVRRHLLPVLSLVPLFILSLILAGRVLPPEHHRVLNIFEIAAMPIELGVLGWIVWRGARAFGGARTGDAGDPLVSLYDAARELVHEERIAGVLATEIAVFHYAFGGWRKGPHVPAGTTAFTHHEKCGHGGVILGATFLILFEGLAMHFLVSLWSPVVAWMLTFGSVYTLVWLFADFRATVRRPILVDDDHVTFRAGLRWTTRVPRALIREILREKPAFDRKEMLSLTLLGTPTHWIVLSEPVTVKGPYGIARRIRAFGLEPDQPEAFAGISGHGKGSPRG